VVLSWVDLCFHRYTIQRSLQGTRNGRYKTALESFKKADEINGKDKELFITDANGLPILKSNQMAVWQGGYLNTGASQYQEEDLEGALKNFEKAQEIMPTDTTAFFYAGFVSNGLEQYDKAITNFQKYNELGGKIF
jgi:tetratricopeptide (TPR) repeat protein